MEDERRSVCSQEYLTMPCVRDQDWPVNKIYSIPLKIPGQGHILENMWDEKRANKVKHTEKKVIQENLAILENKANFVNTTTLKGQMARLQRHVQLGLKRAEDDLELKRNKLKTVILQEDTALTHEYVERAQKLADQLYEEKKKFAEEVLKRKIKEQEEEARTKLEQLERDNSEKLKERISIIKRLEAAEIQKHQICEKKILLQREEEFNKFWLEIQRKRDEEMLKYEEEEEILRVTRIKEQRETLNKQIIGKQMMQEEIKKIREKESAYNEKLRERLKEEEEKEREYKMLQKLEQMKIQKAQLEEVRKLKDERQREQEAFDNFYVKSVNDILRKDEIKTMDKRAEIRKEAEFFMQQLKEIKAAQAEEERQIEELRGKEVEKKEATIRANQTALKEARDKLNRETLEMWKHQIIHKQNVLEAERQIEKASNEWSNRILDTNRKLDKLLEDRHKTCEVERIKDLEWQQKYEDILNKREKTEEEEFKTKKEREDHKKEELIRTFGTCFGPPHPFTKAILDNQ